MKETITIERLKERLSYDPESGIFIWRETFSGTCIAGRAAGRMGTGKAAGYMRITIDRREYKAHRLAWFYMTGEWPSDQIDHINMIGSDNRFKNLRLCDQSQNKGNSKMYKNNKSGVKGVAWDKSSGKFIANIQYRRKQIYLGRFDRLEDAARAYQHASAYYFGEFSRTS